MKLSIVIPVFNEEKTIDELLSRVFDVKIPGWTTEIIVVNDASTDNTLNLLKKYGKAKIISLPKNSGKGTAVATGLSHATGDYIIIQDADLEYHPKEIHSLVLALYQGKAEVIYGSRNLHPEKRKGFIFQRLGVWVPMPSIILCLADSKPNSFLRPKFCVTDTKLRRCRFLILPETLRRAKKLDTVMGSGQSNYCLLIDWPTCVRLNRELHRITLISFAAHFAKLIYSKAILV
jgi:glycosyltransferase involved in cell wall biosynthesis